MNASLHFGSSFEDWLKEQGIAEEVTAHAVERVGAWQAEQTAIDRHIDRYFALLQSQLDQSPDDWTASFTFPEPRDAAEKAAFARFVAQLREARIPIDPVEFSKTG